MPDTTQKKKSDSLVQQPPSPHAEHELDIAYQEDLGENELLSTINAPYIGRRKNKPRISEVDRKVEELTITQNTIGKEMADAIVDNAYRQTSRHYSMERTNIHQQEEINFLREKLDRLEKLMESQLDMESSQGGVYQEHRQKSHTAFHPQNTGLMEDIDEEIPPQRNTQYTYFPHSREPKGKIPTRGDYLEEMKKSSNYNPQQRQQHVAQSTTSEYKNRTSTAPFKLRSSEEPNYQGPPFAKYRDQSESVGQTYGNAFLGVADRKIDPIREFGGSNDLKFFENWLILLRGKIRDNEGHWGSDDRIMNFIFASTKDDAQELLGPYFTGEDPENDFVNSVQMVNHLIATYRSSTLQRDSMVKFEALRQGSAESFQDFKTRFISLAGKAKIHHSMRKDQLYEKMNRQLKLAVFAQLHLLPDFNSLCQYADPVDKERIRLEKSMVNTKSERFNSRRLYNPDSSTYQSVSVPVSRTDTKEESLPSRGVICYHCKKRGHTKLECPNKSSKLGGPTVQVVAIEEADSELDSEGESQHSSQLQEGNEQS